MEKAQDAREITTPNWLKIIFYCTCNLNLLSICCDSVGFSRNILNVLVHRGHPRVQLLHHLSKWVESVDCVAVRTSSSVWHYFGDLRIRISSSYCSQEHNETFEVIDQKVVNWQTCFVDVTSRQFICRVRSRCSQGDG